MSVKLYVEHSGESWEILDKRQTEDYRVAISNEDGSIIGYAQRIDDSIHPDEEKMANARLMASSPALIEACINIYENMCDREELWDCEKDEEYDEVMLIRIAIEKALNIKLDPKTGETIEDES